jgi:hypothetical protein
MKKPELKNINFKPGFLKKYNYNINDVIGVKGNDRFILYTDRKLIRIYRGSLKSKAILSTYIPIEHAIFYSFEIEKNIIEKVDIEHFIETKVYEEAGVDETENYKIKYKIIDSMKDEKIVTVEVIIVPAGYIENGYKEILDETGYIDYISFPAFAYKALYDEQIIQKANDLFVVFLYDKVFLTFYNDGNLLSIVTISGGLEKVYESLCKLKIKNFDINVFEKLLTKKGINNLKYNNAEKAVLNIIQDEFLSLINIINSQIEKIGLKYNISNIDRIFVTSEYGNIEGLQEYIQKIIEIDAFGFEFYEEYNLDRLSVNPFLFLGMLEAHNAYTNNDQRYNFSLYLRKPTFLYRPSGRLLLILLAMILGMGIYPLYLYFNGMFYEKENKELEKVISRLRLSNIKYNIKIKKLESKKSSLFKQNDKYIKDINFQQKFIKDVYTFKYDYMPKSRDLTDLANVLTKHHVYLKYLKYSSVPVSVLKRINDIFLLKNNIKLFKYDIVKNRKKLLSLKDKYDILKNKKYVIVGIDTKSSAEFQSVFKKMENEKFKGYVLSVYSDKISQISDCINDLINNGFVVDTPGIKRKDNRYEAIIRIKE